MRLIWYIWYGRWILERESKSSSGRVCRIQRGSILKTYVLKKLSEIPFFDNKASKQILNALKRDKAKILKLNQNFFIVYES